MEHSASTALCVPPELSSQANIDDGLPFLEDLDTQRFLESQLSGISADLNSFLSDVSVPQTMQSSGVNNAANDCFILEGTQTSVDIFNNIAVRMESSNASVIQNNSTLKAPSLADDLPFCISEMECEKFHNIEDFFKQDLGSAVSVASETDSDLTIADVPAEQLTCSSVDDSMVIAEGNVSIQKNSDTPCEERLSSEMSREVTKSKTEKSPHEKYLEMRRKNNIASRRSRQSRKERDMEMVEKAKELEAENKVLKLTVERLEKQRDALKCYLLKAVKKS